MDSPGYIVLSRLTAQQRAASVTAHNLANADTPGFRASRPVFGAFLEQQGRSVERSQRPANYVWDRATWRDNAPGPAQQTGNPLDLSISGEGFFVIETPRGDRYTRAGRFTIGGDGRIVDGQGQALLTDQGRPIAVSPNDLQIEVQGDGTVRSENGVLGRIRIVRFGNEQAMRAEGDRLFAADETPEDVTQPGIVQGTLEGSNVQAVVEMTRMMAELREFQLVTQFVDREGERLQTAVDRILRRRN
jgi:flagellar basal-body rod protein FlgF